jgi:hypothetical protein
MITSIVLQMTVTITIDSSFRLYGLTDIRPIHEIDV